MALKHADGTVKKNNTLPVLVDFEDREDLKTFAGVITYQNTLDVKETCKGEYLDLGKINGIIGSGFRYY